MCRMRSGDETMYYCELKGGGRGMRQYKGIEWLIIISPDYYYTHHSSLLYCYNNSLTKPDFNFHVSWSEQLMLIVAWESGCTINDVITKIRAHRLSWLQTAGRSTLPPPPAFYRSPSPLVAVWQQLASPPPSPSTAPPR